MDGIVRMDGEMVFEYDSKERAEMIAMLIQIDNEIAPKTLSIKTKAQGKNVVTSISSKKASTFFATLDDILSSEELIYTLLDYE